MGWDQMQLHYVTYIYKTTTFFSIYRPSQHEKVYIFDPHRTYETYLICLTSFFAM